MLNPRSLLVYAAALVMGAALAGGCRRASAPGEAGPAPTPNGPDGRPLLEVSLPDLSRMDEAGRAQVRERHAALTRTIGTRPAGRDELGRAYGEMGSLLMALEYLDAAEPALLNAHALVPDSIRWPYYLGHLYRQRSELEKSAAFFDKALALRPDDVVTLLWLGSVHLDQDRPDDADATFARARSLQPQSVAALFGAGRAALAKREYARAVKYLNEALRLNPKGTVIHYPLAMAYRGVGDMTRADAHLRQRGDVKVDPPDPLMEELQGLVQTAQVFERRGFAAIGQGDWKAAAAHFRQAAALAPQNALVRLNLGTALLRTGDGRGALRQYEEAVRLSPESANAHLSLGLLLELSGRDREAIARFSAAVVYDPNLSQAHLTLADALRRNGRVEESLSHYERVMEVDPDVSDARFGHAMALVRLGRYLQARDDLAEASKVVPDRRRFAHALARLLAAAPDDRVRNGRQAMAIVEELLQGERTIELAETYAMTLAELGRYADAAGLQREALATARRSGGDERLLARLTRSLSQFERGEPSRTPWSDDDPIHAPRPQVEPDLLEPAAIAPRSR